MPGTKKKSAKKSGKENGSKKCKCKADAWVVQFAGPTYPPPRGAVRSPADPVWLRDFYDAYWELYRAVARIEREQFGMPFTRSDSIVSDPRAPNPGPDKAGCPPPPPFPR